MSVTRCARKKSRTFLIKLLTYDVIVFIYPTYCAPIGLGHKVKISTASCGHEHPNQKRSSYKLWQLRKQRRRAAAARKRARPKRAAVAPKRARPKRARRSANLAVASKHNLQRRTLQSAAFGALQKGRRLLTEARRPTSFYARRKTPFFCLN